jgi:hypothetical protein
MRATPADRDQPPRLLYAKIERHPNHLGRTVLWAAASAPYGVRDHPGEDIGQILVAGWL